MLNVLHNETLPHSPYHVLNVTAYIARQEGYQDKHSVHVIVCLFVLRFYGPVNPMWSC